MAALFQFQSSFEVPWFFLGLSLVYDRGEAGKVQGKEILIEVLFICLEISLLLQRGLRARFSR